MRKLILLVLVFSLSATSFVTAQAKQTQKEIFASTYHNSKTLVKTQQFQYVGEMVYNSEKREKLNNDSNKITIDKSEILGQLISVNSDNKTIDVSGKIENYNVSFNDDIQLITITFSVNTVIVTIEVKPNGNAFLTGTSSNNSTINWTGKLKTLK